MSPHEGHCSPLAQQPLPADVSTQLAGIDRQLRLVSEQVSGCLRGIVELQLHRSSGAEAQAQAQLPDEPGLPPMPVSPRLRGSTPRPRQRLPACDALLPQSVRLPRDPHDVWRAGSAPGPSGVSEASACLTPGPPSIQARVAIALATPPPQQKSRSQSSLPSRTADLQPTDLQPAESPWTSMTPGAPRGKRDSTASTGVKRMPHSDTIETVKTIGGKSIPLGQRFHSMPMTSLVSSAQWRKYAHVGSAIGYAPSSAGTGSASVNPVFSMLEQLPGVNNVESWTQHRKRSKFAQSVWDVLEHPDSGAASFLYSWFMPKLIVASVVVTLAQTVPNAPLGGIPAACIETIFEAFFFAEIAARFMACPNRFVFFGSWYNNIDILAVAPVFLRAAVGFELTGGITNRQAHDFLFGTVPVIRLLKSLRHFTNFRLLLHAFSETLEALPVLLFTLLLMALLFSSLIYFVEDRDNIESLPEATWLAIVTMNTIGYGEIQPKTGPGYVFVAVLAVSSCLYMAIPLGMIGKNFTDIWQDRHRILLMQRLRDCLERWGHAPQDIPTLFEAFDTDGSGELDLEEFRYFMEDLHIGFKVEEYILLYESLETDDNLVTAKSFVRTLFPETFLEIYGHKKHKHASVLSRLRTKAGLGRASVFDPSSSRMSSDVPPLAIPQGADVQDRAAGMVQDLGAAVREETVSGL